MGSAQIQKTIDYRAAQQAREAGMTYTEYMDRVAAMRETAATQTESQRRNGRSVLLPRLWLERRVAPTVGCTNADGCFRIERVIRVVF